VDARVHLHREGVSMSRASRYTRAIEAESETWRAVREAWYAKNPKPEPLVIEHEHTSMGAGRLEFSVSTGGNCTIKGNLSILTPQDMLRLATWAIDTFGEDEHV
jgi:hypothetical protein